MCWSSRPAVITRVPSISFTRARFAVRIPPVSSGPASIAVRRTPVSQLESRHFLADFLLADRLPDLGEVGLLAPQFELVAHAEQHGSFVDPGRRTLAGWQQHAGCAIQLHLSRGPDQLQHQIAMRALDAGQRADVVAHALPLGQRKQPEATLFERVVRDDQMVVAGARQRLAVGRGNGQPPFVVHTDCGFTLEHATSLPTFSHKTTRGPTLVAAGETVKKISLLDQWERRSSD